MLVNVAHLLQAQSELCFQVADRSNSRVVLDEVGAEKLLGRGDMLFQSPDASQPQPLRPGSAQQRLADALGTPETPLPD